MSKITNDGCTHMATVGVKGSVIVSILCCVISAVTLWVVSEEWTVLCCRCGRWSQSCRMPVSISRVLKAGWSLFSTASDIENWTPSSVTSSRSVVTWCHCVSHFSVFVLVVIQITVKTYLHLNSQLTLWHPLLPYRYSYKASCAGLG